MHHVTHLHALVQVNHIGEEIFIETPVFTSYQILQQQKMFSSREIDREEKIKQIRIILEKQKRNLRV